MNSRAYEIGQQAVAQFIKVDSVNGESLRIMRVDSVFGGEG